MLKYIAIVLFVAIAVGVGIYSRKRTSTMDDFFLGGRDLGPWLSTFAYGTTYFSAVAFIGFGGKVGFVYGFSGIWIAVGNAILGSVLAWVVLARRTRSMTVRLKAMTLPEYMAARYSSPPMKIAAAAIIFIFLIPYSAGVYTGLSYLFEKGLNINYNWALLLMAGVTAVYLVLGGYFAVARNDVIQGVVMIVGVVFMVGFLLADKKVGGFAGAYHKLHAIPAGKAHPFSLTGLWPHWNSGKGSGFETGFLMSPGVQLLSLILFTSLGVWGMPQMVHKFYAIKSERVIKPAAIMTGCFAILISGAAFFSGSLTSLFIDLSKPGMMVTKMIGGVATPSPNFDVFVPSMIIQSLPDVLIVLVMLLVLSASISTLASLVLISSSAVTVDLVQGGFKAKISKKTSIVMMRSLVVLFVVLSVIVAKSKWSFIITLMSISWGAVAGAFIGPYVWGLFSRRITKAAAWTSMAAGLAITLGLGWKYDWNSKYMPVFATLAMLFSLVITPLVSMVTPQFSAEHVARCFGDGVQTEVPTVGAPVLEGETA